MVDPGSLRSLPAMLPASNCVAVGGWQAGIPGGPIADLADFVKIKV